MLFHLDGYPEKPIEFNVVLDFEPDRVGKIDLAENLVGAGGVGWRIPADDGLLQILL